METEVNKTADGLPTKIELSFLSAWTPGNKESTWSGTNWGLFQALQKYMSVKDIDIYRQSTLTEKILRKLNLFPKMDLDIHNIKKQRIYVNQVLRGASKKVIFQFAEIIKDTPLIKTYIYQDLAVPYIDYMRTNYPDDYAVSAFQNVPLKYVRKRAATQMEYYRHCAGIFTMGKWLKEYLTNECGLPKCKIFSIGGGINVNKELIQDDITKNGKRILFVGRDYIRKGLPELYAAFKVLKETIPDAELYVAGPAQDPYPDALGGYHYLGDCSHDKLSELLNLCDVFAMPSHFEAYGLVFIEALCYGLPCLGRNAYEMPYFIEDGKTGLLVDNYDPVVMAEKLARLLADEEIKKNVRGKREWYLKEYSWDAVAERIAEVISRQIE